MNTNSIRDAVTAVLCCQGEILMVRRQPQLPSFSGYWAFPGGKIEAADATAETSLLCAETEHAVLVDLSGHTLVLRLDNWRDGPDLFPNFLTAMVAAMTLALVSVLVLLQVAGALQCSLAELIGDVSTSSPEWLLIRELLENRDEIQCLD